VILGFATFVYMDNASWKEKDNVCEVINAFFFENPIEHTINEPKKKNLKKFAIC
jgi:hypothetical protein